MSNAVVLCTAGYDHKIRFWDASTGVCTKSILFSETSQINCIQISNDKTLLVAGGNQIIHVYDINSTDEKPILTYEGHTSNITSIGFQKDLKWLFSCSEDGTVRIWDPRSNTATRTYDCGCAVNTAVLNPNQAEIISGDQNGYVKIWDLEKDQCREEYLPSADLPVRSISIACDASLLAVGSHKGKVFVYAPTATPKVENQTLELIQEFQAHDDYLLKCVISPDVNTIATCSADKTIKLWNTSTWELENTLSQHQRWVWDAVFSADSNYLVTASSDQSGRLWDLRTGEVIRNYTGHNLTVTCLALCDAVT